jgi:MFS family permease
MKAARVTDDRPPVRNGLVEALSQPNFRLYWFGLLGVTFSVDMLRFAFPWLAYHLTGSLTGSPLAVGLVAFAFGVPNLVLAPFGGVLADRVGRGPIIRITQALEVLLSLVLATVLLMGVTDIRVVAVLAALIGAVLAFDQPARQAMVPALVPRAVLINAVALVSTAWGLARITGPALGGLLLALFLAHGISPGGLFLIVAGGFVLMFLCMWRVVVPATPPPVRAQSVLRDMAEGFLFIGRQPKLLALFIVVAVGSTFGQSFTVLMPVIALEV